MLKPPDACTHIFGKSENLFRLDNDTEDSLPQVWTISWQMVMLLIKLNDRKLWIGFI